MNTITLNNGVTMPQLGFGVYQIPSDETAQAVYEAIKIGYRLIDTAAVYGNEKETGAGIKQAIEEGLVTREELFVTSKLFILQTPEEQGGCHNRALPVRYGLGLFGSLPDSPTLWRYLWCLAGSGGGSTGGQSAGDWDFQL